MTASNSLSFDVIDDALRRAGAVTEPAEAHGSLCGLACVLGADAQSSWLADTLTTAEEPDLPAEEIGEGSAGIQEAAALLGGLAAASTRALEAGDMSFQPLLPADDEPLEERTAALAAWCQGFNYGLALAVRFGDADEAVRHEAIAEIVRDFAEMSQLGYQEDEGDRDAEADWAELVEYVRVSVQLVFEEMAGVRQRVATAVRH
ncbi:MAG: UPF0149 family protein [Gammaproteobacteria bacterium]|nr:UPF0149 family protein [Gammaproteobacteria bacterium]MCP5140048.1 UPF0149 family protein [Chromatiales bacterium]